MAKQAKQTEKRLSIDKIKCSKDIQPRVEMDANAVAEYAERIEAGDDLPKVVVYYDGTTYWLTEGFHRLAAYKKLGRKQVDCIVINGTKADAQWHAIRSNRGHGLPRSNADKARAVGMAFVHPEGRDKSDRAIADLLGVSPTMVAKYRPKDATAKDGQSKSRVGRDGRTTNTAKIGKGKKGNRKSSPKSAAKAGDKQNGKAQKVATPQTERDVEDPAVEGGDKDPVVVYRLMLENLPATLDELTKRKDEIAGKAMKSKAARQALAHIVTRILVLQEAEETSGGKRRRSSTKVSDYDIE